MKGNEDEELRQEIPFETQEHEFVDLLEIPQRYTKETEDYSPQLIVIITEDGVTTGKYLQCMLGKKIRGVRVEIETDKACGVPAYRMANKARTVITEYGLQLSDLDKLYLLVDLDHYRSDILELYPECVKENWRLIISNPCVEIWFHYHLYKQAPVLGHQTEERHYSQKMKDHLFNGANLQVHRLIEHVTIAIENSKLNYKLEKGSNFMPALCATQMHNLLEPLQLHIQDCLDQDVAKREKRKREWSNRN